MARLGRGSATTRITVKYGPAPTGPSRVIGGSLTPSAALARMAAKGTAGSATGTGTVSRSGLARFLAGSTVPTGTKTTNSSRRVSASSTPAGSIIRAYPRVVSGAITLAGIVARQTQKMLSGSVSSTGAVRRDVAGRKLTASFTAAGSVRRTAAKTLGGAAAPAGSVSGSRGLMKTLAGAFSPTGVLRKVAKKYPAGSLTPSSEALRRSLSIRRGGLLAPVGSVLSAIYQRVFGRAGTITATVGTAATVELTVYLRQRVQLQVFTAADVAIQGQPFLRTASPLKRAARPFPPVAVTARPRYQSADVSFVAGEDGGSQVTSFTVTASTGQTATGTSSPITVGGLTNGTPVTFYVVATNQVGDSMPSASSAAVTPNPGVPDKPTNVTATPGNGQATVAFTAPANTGGSPLTGYLVSCSDGQVVSATSSPATVSGLSNGGSYTFVVTAQSSAGASAPSDRTAAVTPATVPSTPSVSSLSAGAGQVVVGYTSGGDGGAPITSWTVRAYIGSGGTVAATVTSSSSSATVPGLTNGTGYTFTVTATNRVGVSPASARSSTATPQAAGITAGTATTGTGSGSTLVLTKPSGAVAGACLVAGFATNGYDVTSAPAGWTLIGKADAGNPEVYAYYRVLTSADAAVSSWTWGMAGSGNSGGGIQAYAGVHPTNVLDVAAVTVAATSSSAISVSATLSPVTPQAMLVGVAGANSGVVGYTPPAGWVTDYTTAGKSSHQSHYAAAAAGSASYTWTPSDHRAQGLVAFALRPAA